MWVVDSVKRITVFWMCLPLGSSPASDSPWSHKQDRLCVFPLYYQAFCLVKETILCILNIRNKNTFCYCNSSEENYTTLCCFLFFFCLNALCEPKETQFSPRKWRNLCRSSGENKQQRLDSSSHNTKSFFLFSFKEQIVK